MGALLGNNIITVVLYFISFSDSLALVKKIYGGTLKLENQKCLFQKGNAQNIARNSTYSTRLLCTNSQ